MGPAKKTAAPAPVTFEHEGLVLVVSDGEPLVSDEALATHLGLPLTKLRELSGRHERAENISPIINPTVGFNRGRPGKQRLYTEADALFLVTRCETPQAIGVTKKMIAAFIAARRQLGAAPVAPALPPKAPPAPPPVASSTPTGLMTRSGIHDDRWTRMRARKVSLMALAAGLDQLIFAEDWAALSISLDLMAAFARPTLPLDAPATVAGKPPLLTVRELGESLHCLLLEEDWRGVLLTAEMIAHLAAPHAGPTRRSA